MSPKILFLINLLLYCIIISSASAQTILKGVVLDEDTQSTVPFTTIMLYENGTLITGTDTDFEGNYLFSNIDSGVYTLEARFLGYMVSRVEEFVVSADKLNTLDFQLEEERGLSCFTPCCAIYRIPLISLSDTSTGQTLIPMQNRRRSTQSIILFKGRKKHKQLKKANQ